MISISDIETPDKDTLKFVVSDCNSSFVNAIRRTILSEVETVSFNIDNYEPSDLTVLKNTSTLHNEFLLHRLGQIRIELKGVAAVDGHDRVFGDVGQEKFVFAALGRLQAKALLGRLRIGIEHGATPHPGTAVIHGLRRIAHPWKRRLRAHLWTLKMTGQSVLIN